MTFVRNDHKGDHVKCCRQGTKPLIISCRLLQGRFSREGRCRTDGYPFNNFIESQLSPSRSNLQKKIAAMPERKLQVLPASACEPSFRAIRCGHIRGYL